MWANSVYGGSVFGGIDTKKNNLAEQVNKLEINALHGGGYYCFTKVALRDEFANIYILID